MKTGIVMSAPLDRFGEAAKHIRGIGYDCVDLQQYVNPASAFYGLPEEAVRAAKEALHANGLAVSQIHGPWLCPPPNGTPEERAFWLEKARGVVRACALFDCPNMVIHPLMPPEYFTRRDPEKVTAVNREFFEALLPFARAEGVTVCLENMPFDTPVLSRPQEILDFVRSFESPRFRICLDTGHCSVRGESPAEALRLLGKEYAAALHIHDNNGDRDDHLNPFEGSIDWRDFSDALREIGFDGTASLETTVNADPSKVPGSVIRAKEQVLFRSVKAIADGLFE